MKALLLAAGYATRLRPLTNEVAKPLLPVGGRPMVDWIVDRIEAAGAVDEIHLVTNSVYAAGFERWARERGIVVHDDDTSSNETRLGAIGDVRFAMHGGAADDDGLLVIAADNLFEFSVGEYIDFWRRKGGSALAVHRLADAELARLYGVVELDADDRVIAMEEKPERPRSDLVSTAMYLFSSDHLAVLERYLDDGLPPDPPGRFLAWLAGNELVYGFRFSEPWLDIGDHGQLLEADNRYRVEVGLPPRTEYALS
jgi:glucose-1-phosphate thymidylyltransferase